MRRVAAVLTTSAVVAAVAAPSTGAQQVTSTSFRAGKQIGCSYLKLQEPILRCDLLFLNDVGYTVQGTSKGRKIKITDTVYDPSAPLLKSGKSWTKGPFTCRRSGGTLTCRHRTSKHGFTVSRSSQRAF